MLASYRVHEISSRDALTPGLSVLRTKVFRSLIACKTFYRQTCAKTSPILLFGHAALPPRIPKQFLSGELQEQHQPHGSLAGILGGKNVGAPNTRKRHGQSLCFLRQKRDHS